MENQENVFEPQLVGGEEPEILQFPFQQDKRWNTDSYCPDAVVFDSSRPQTLKLSVSWLDYQDFQPEESFINFALRRMSQEEMDYLRSLSPEETREGWRREVRKTYTPYVKLVDGVVYSPSRGIIIESFGKIGHIYQQKIDPNLVYINYHTTPRRIRDRGEALKEIGNIPFEENSQDLAEVLGREEPLAGPLEGNGFPLHSRSLKSRSPIPSSTRKDFLALSSLNIRTSPGTSFSRSRHSGESGLGARLFTDSLSRKDFPLLGNSSRERVFGDRMENQVTSSVFRQTPQDRPRFYNCNSPRRKSYAEAVRGSGKFENIKRKISFECMDEDEERAPPIDKRKAKRPSSLFKNNKLEFTFFDEKLHQLRFDKNVEVNLVDIPDEATAYSQEMSSYKFKNDPSLKLVKTVAIGHSCFGSGFGMINMVKAANAYRSHVINYSIREMQEALPYIIDSMCNALEELALYYKETSYKEALQLRMEGKVEDAKQCEYEAERLFRLKMESIDGNRAQLI